LPGICNFFCAPGRVRAVRYRIALALIIAPLAGCSRGQTQPKHRRVMVAEHTLPPGRPIWPEDLREVEMPVPFLDHRGVGAISPQESSEVFAQAPLRVVLEGDVLRWADFEPLRQLPRGLCSTCEWPHITMCGWRPTSHWIRR
jgi:hypothetical protein